MVCKVFSLIEQAPVQITEKGLDDPLMESFPEQIIFFQWHGDTFGLPDGTVRLAGSNGYPNQAMRSGEISYGFQFHFEVTKDMIVDWLNTGREDIEEMGVNNLPEKIIQDSDRYLPVVHAIGKDFFSKYLDMITRSAESLSDI